MITSKNNNNLKTFFCTSFLVIIVAAAAASAGIVYSIGLEIEIIKPDTVFAQVDNTALSVLNTSSLNFDPDTGKYAEASSTINRQITLIAQDAELEIAPGKIVKAWTFNGTVPGPTIRMAEGENVTVKFINDSPIPHTIHFHGNHDDVNDGVLPQIMPGESYLYNITGEPAGALMYHCHTPPVSLHIRMGMYGALIVDPLDKPVLPAKEFVMVMGEYSLEDQLGLDADYYLINGYADQYMKHPIEINHGDLMRIYAINIGTTIPYPFHLHSTTYKAYPSGLWENEPQLVQTIPIAPGDASIIEAKWKYPGTYLFHSHGIQEEHGNMGQINVIGISGTEGDINVDTPTSTSTSTSSSIEQSHQMSSQSLLQQSNKSNTFNATQTPLTESVSMFDWQYELQKNLQKPKIINYTQEQQQLDNQVSDGQITESEKRQQKAENISIQTDRNLSTNITDTNNTDITLMDNINNNSTEIGKEISDESNNNKTMNISIVPGSGNPSSEEFYSPSSPTIQPSTTLTWINDDNLPHTVTSGDPSAGPTGEFDSSIINPQETFAYTFEKEGVYNYYCTLHPWMIASVIVK